MASRMVNVSFHFEKDTFRLLGLNEDTIEKPIDELNCFTDLWTTLYYFEYPMGKNGEKWVFSWSQWAKKEQYFRIKQYVPFPKTDYICEPIDYKPWSILAEWTCIANPSFGFTPPNTIYKRIYHDELNQKKLDFSFDVSGNPAIINWNTQNAIVS